MKQRLLNLLAALIVYAALNHQLSIALAQGTNFPMLTITNPVPLTDAQFGYSVAGVGNARLVIGAIHDWHSSTKGGEAYLFNFKGEWLATFANPTPESYDSFGGSVAAVGTDRVLITADGDNTGASLTGAAYLFTTNGTLLTTFTNPTPVNYAHFGRGQPAVAAMGDDRVLIGAGGDGTCIAYLFNTEGALLTSFTNSATNYYGLAGTSLTAVGSDRVLIGIVYYDTPSTVTEAAYLFSTNGALLTTFTNPTPVTNVNFGYPVAALGADRVLISSDAVVTNSSVCRAYLFSANGSLLTTFTNPTPSAYDGFGAPLVVVGNDRVLIGASGAGSVGAAYLFNTNGALLTTFTNPTPAYLDRFGLSVAALGTDRVLISAPWDNARAARSGVAYLFDLPSARPALSISSSPNSSVIVSWPSPSTGWTLQQNTNSVASGLWNNVTNGIQDDGTTKTLSINPPTGGRYYRVFKP